MDRFIAQDIPEQQREQVIADSCDAIESIGYTRRLSRRREDSQNTEGIEGGVNRKLD